MTDIHELKSDKKDQVIKAVITLLDRHGLDAITFARVHQLSEVSRAWLYKYIGNEKQDLVNFAVETMGRQWGRLDQPWDANSLKEMQQQMYEATLWVIQYAAQYPQAIGPYFRFQGSNSPIGETIAKIEIHVITHLSKQFIKNCGLEKKEARNRAYMVLMMRMSFAFRASKDKELNVEEFKPLIKKFILSVTS